MGFSMLLDVQWAVWGEDIPGCTELNLRARELWSFSVFKAIGCTLSETLRITFTVWSSFFVTRYGSVPVSD